jgi:ribose 5-phosphate isomerase B
MKIAIGADHAAFDLKNRLGEFLRGLAADVIDMGTNGPGSVDYPDFGEKVAMAVIEGAADRGVLICGTGIGMSIVANKFAGIRAALCSEPVSARMSRLHNDANVLVLGGRMIGPIMAEEIVRVWLETPFEGERHQRRLGKIIEIEERFRRK